MLPRTLFYTTVFAAATLAQYGEDPSETDSSDPALQSAVSRDIHNTSLYSSHAEF